MQNFIDKSIVFFKHVLVDIQNSEIGNAAIDFFGIPTTYEDLFTVGVTFIVVSILSYLIIRIIQKMVKVCRIWWKFGFYTEGHYDINKKNLSEDLSDDQKFENETRFYRGRLRYYIEKYNETDNVDINKKYIYVTITEQFINFVFQKSGKPNYRLYLDYMEKNKIISTYSYNMITVPKSILIK